MFNESKADNKNKSKTGRAVIIALLVVFAAVTAVIGVRHFKLYRIHLYDLLGVDYFCVRDATVEEMADAVRSGKVSSTSLTKYYLYRIERYNDEYNCFITMCDNALDEAAKRDEAISKVSGSSGSAGGSEAAVETPKTDGLLYGVPVVIKDNYDYAGYPTTNGYSRERAYIATENAYAVDRLLDEGAIIIGKTNMSTEAQSAADSLSFAIGETYNAYSRELSPGGSSGGTAVAVSLKMAAAGLGSDTNSSLRLPAAYNGDVTLRSTTGLVSTEGIVPLSRSRDVAGAITRNVEDLAVMMDVLTDREHNYREALRDDALEGVRIGVVRELSYAGCGSMYAGLVDEEVAKAFNNAIRELEECGAEVVDIDISTFTYDEFFRVKGENDLTAVIYPTMLSGSLPSGTLGPGQSLASTHDTLNRLSDLCTSLGLPEMTVPIGNESDGCGIGMEILADKYEEQTLLDLAYSYMSRYDHRREPDPE